MYFLFDDSRTVIDQLARNGRRDHAIFVVRPNELGLEQYARPVHEWTNPEGRVVLQIFDLYL